MSRALALILFLCLYNVSANAADSKVYTVYHGDVLQDSVWKENDLQLIVLERPDGGMSLTLIREVQAAGKTVQALRDELSKRFSVLVADAVVTVGVIQLLGNKIYVLGMVTRPGEFT